jgi:hypothetical protein
LAPTDPDDSTEQHQPYEQQALRRAQYRIQPRRIDLRPFV